MSTTSTPIDRLVEALNLAALSAEEQEVVIEDLNDLILRGTLSRLVDHMDDKTQQEFKELLATNPDAEALDAFLLARVPDAKTAAKETIDEITDDILAVSKE